MRIVATVLIVQMLWAGVCAAEPGPIAASVSRQAQALAATASAADASENARGADAESDCRSQHIAGWGALVGGLLGFAAVIPFAGMGDRVTGSGIAAVGLGGASLGALIGLFAGDAADKRRVARCEQGR